MAHFPDYVTLLIDQESHRETKLVMEALHPIGTEEKITYTPYLGSVQPMAFSSSRFQQAPALRKLEVGGCDFLSRQASFSLKYNGTWNIRGKDNGAVWTLQYSVDDKLRTNGKRVAGEKVMRAM